MIAPQLKSVEIYYLENKKYALEKNYILQDNIDDEYYNAEAEKTV